MASMGITSQPSCLRSVEIWPCWRQSTEEMQVHMLLQLPATSKCKSSTKEREQILLPVMLTTEQSLRLETSLAHLLFQGLEKSDLKCW